MFKHASIMLFALLGLCACDAPPATEANAPAVRAEIYKAGPLVQRNILPLIKPKAWLAQFDAKDAPVHEDYNDALLIAYAEQSPGTTRYFHASDLQAAKLKPALLHELAIDNLRKLFDGKITYQPDMQVGMFGCDGEHEASLILLDEIWDRRILSGVQGAPVIAIPATKWLFVTGADNASGVQHLRAIAADSAARPGVESISAQLFVRKDGKFVPL